MKAYKGFDKNMRCRGFQFAEGETYHEEAADLCRTGFHACQMPLDVLTYYPPSAGNVYREVELEEVTDQRQIADTKICGKTIKIGAELSIAGLVKAQIEYIKKTSGSAETEHATGDLGAASATGEASAAMASGKDGCVMGTLGCALFAVERGEWNGKIYPILSVAAGIVDGEALKPGIWYWCRNGELVEIEE